MSKIWEKQYPDEDAYMFSPIKGPTLRERLFNWLFCAEGAERYENRGEYEKPQGIKGAGHYEPVPDLNRRSGVKKALNDWKAATAYFESVSDPELVDYAVYEMEAAEKRYIYLLRGAKDADRRKAR